MRTLSHSKSFRNSQLHTPEKKKYAPYVSPFHSHNQNQLTEKTKKTKQKLTLERGCENRPPSSSLQDSNYHLMARLKSEITKYRDLVSHSSD